MSKELEAIVAEMRSYDGDPFGQAHHKFHGWADRVDRMAESTARLIEVAGGSKTLLDLLRRSQGLTYENVASRGGSIVNVTECISALDEAIRTAIGSSATQSGEGRRDIATAPEGMVLVPVSSAKMVAHVCSEWIDLFRDAPGLDKYERYSYEPAVEELRDEFAAIAALPSPPSDTKGE
jgi:hypothetical protein